MGSSVSLGFASLFEDGRENVFFRHQVPWPGYGHLHDLIVSQLIEGHQSVVSTIDLMMPLLTVD